MRQIHYVIQTLLRGKGSIPFKVISLGLGLAMSILLFARVAYEQSYDTCFRDYDRIYQVWSQFVMNGEKLEPQTMNMGPLAGAILESFPKEVEGATCTCATWRPGRSTMATTASTSLKSAPTRSSSRRWASRC